MSKDSGTGRAPNLRDVARLAGVSHQTVSRVLNHHPSLRPSTEERVLRAMETLHYRPNRAARMLVTSRSRTIGVLAAASGSYYGPASSINGIEDAARAAGYYVSIANLDAFERESITAAVDHLMAQAVEGIVIIAPQTRVSDAIAELSLGVPFVTLQSAHSADRHTMMVDQSAGAQSAMQHLIDLGHRHILHLAGPQDWFEAEARLRGYLTALESSGLQRMEPVFGDWTADFGYHAGRELVLRRDFTAVFSSNDQMALGLIHAFHEAGRSIPSDISVVGFDDIPEAAHFWPPLTTVRQDFALLGKRSIALLLRELEDGTNSNKDAIVPELIVRESAAPAA
ncbi:LacI family DNA-binding transcriptional regulator [Rathayibacter soli]|uniref:LacI family DNA-binding transcriptional regulator n=1 Tax=Rathayibacter soli TaxID=3144168 RepID=UPI0027E3C594|nr:LacI family DNA-binding transcriptional regulator [Glaciibacter superstes]